MLLENASRLNVINTETYKLDQFEETFFKVTDAKAVKDKVQVPAKEKREKWTQ